MVTYLFEFESEETMRQAAEYLWRKLKVTGELSGQQVGNHWRLELIAEQPLRPAMIETIGGRLLS